jgi:hypothetical protein
MPPHQQYSSQDNTYTQPQTPIPKPKPPALLPNPIANQRIHTMIARAETPQLHLLPVLDLLRIAIAPLHRHLAIGIRIHQHVERAVAVQLRQERHRRRDLPEDRLDLGLDLDLGLLDRRRGRRVRRRVLLVSGSPRRGFLRRRPREDLDLQARVS